MYQLNVLIDKGDSMYGTQKALAQMLGKPDTHLSMWKRGTKTCSAPDRAELAAAVNENAAVAALEAVMEGLNTETAAGKAAKRELQKALLKVRELYLSASPARGVIRQWINYSHNRTPRNTGCGPKLPRH